MFIAMKPHATQADFDAVIEKVRALGLTPHPISGTERRVVAVVGNTGAVDPDDFAMLTGVAEALRVSQPFKLVSREVKEEDTVIDVDGVQVGGRAITVMAGPCSVESREQILETAHAVKAAGARILRGGAWKPRTSPYEFQGLREEGLKLLALAREETGLKIITEVMSTDTVPLVAEYADILQVGARNMQNYALLETARPGPQAGHAEARPVRNHQGVAHGGRVHRGQGQPQRHALRAGHPHLRDRHPQHPRHQRHPGAEVALPPAGHRRPVARHRDPQARRGHRPGRHRRRGRRHHRSRCTRSRRRRSPTATSPSPSPSSPS